MNKIIKRHSDGSVTTFGEALKAISKGTIVGAVTGSVAALTVLGVAYIVEHAQESNK